MSIEKYLENINIPEEQPGPFAVRLKYELKKATFERRSSFFIMSMVASAAAVCLLVFAGIMVVNPQVAHNIHYAFSDEQPEQNLDSIVFVDDGHYLGQKEQTQEKVWEQGQFFKVSDLSQLDKNKSYMIKPINDRRNKTVFYVSEVQKNSSPRIIY